MPELINFCGNFVRSYKDVVISEQTEVRVMDGVLESTFASLPLSLMAAAEHLWKWLIGMCLCAWSRFSSHFDPHVDWKLWEHSTGFLSAFLCEGGHMRWCCKWCFMAQKSSKNGTSLIQQNPSAWHVSLHKHCRNNNRSDSHSIYIAVNSK